MEFFLFAQFFLNAHQAAYQPEESEEPRSEDSKIRTGQVMDGLSVTQQMIIFSSRLLKYSSNQKFTLVQSNRSLHGFETAHKLHISFATDLAANFGCY